MVCKTEPNMKLWNVQAADKWRDKNSICFNI